MGKLTRILQQTDAGWLTIDADEYGKKGRERNENSFKSAGRPRVADR